MSYMHVVIYLKGKLRHVPRLKTPRYAESRKLHKNQKLGDPVPMFAAPL